MVSGGVSPSRAPVEPLGHRIMAEHPFQTEPDSALRELVASERVTPPTREVLLARLEPEDPRRAAQAPIFFDAGEFATLVAVCARLFPPGTKRPTPQEGARQIDERLAKGNGDGWRLDKLPPDAEAYRIALRGLKGSAQVLAAGNFELASIAQQDAALADFACGKASDASIAGFDQARFFEDLLAELSEFYYSHPLAQQHLGYEGFADAAGWRKVGLNEREPWEPAVGQREFRPLAVLPARVPQRELRMPPGKRFPEHERVDAVVIGTGAGGGPLLARLAQAGLKVVALEAGKFWNPAQDFATDERAQNKLFWTDERLSAGGDPLAFGNNNSGIGVGGSTLHFTAYTPRPQPDDFRLHTGFGVGVDWPLSYADLESYFDELETLLGVSGPTPYLWGPPRRRGYPLSPLPLNAAAQLMQRACADLGIRTSPAPNAALSAPYHQPGIGWRPACTNRGFCQAGCSVGAKASVDVTFIPMALAAGAELRSECFVTQIGRDAHGGVSSVVYTQDGHEHRQRCRHVFLCAGGIETPRLLLMNGLANGSGQVGRNFMAHTGLQLWAHFEEETRPFKGIPGGLISEDTHRPKDADFAGGYLLQSIGVMPVTYASQLARSGQGIFGAALGEHMSRYNHVAGINILGECLPSPQNYLELSEEKDARGLPKPRIHFTAGENERRLTAHAERTMRGIWECAGARDPWAFQRFAHILGACRMGPDPENAVVDADGRCFDVPGLSVCDNSVFPSALAVNPALTIMALSLRTADRFLAARRT